MNKVSLSFFKYKFRQYKSNTLSVLKCRGSLSSCEASCDVPEDGAMTALTVTDRETGKSVTIPLCDLESETGSSMCIICHRFM